MFLNTVLVVLGLGVVYYTFSGFNTPCPRSKDFPGGFANQPIVEAA